MSTQQDEKVESLSVALHRVEVENKKLVASNLSLAAKCNTHSDRAVEAEERCDELALRLAASKTREQVLQCQVDDMLMQRGAAALERVLIAGPEMQAFARNVEVVL